MITIGFDARTFFFRSGLGRYCRNVLASLLKEPEGCRFILWLSNQKSISDFPSEPMDHLEIRISEAPFGSLEAERTVLSHEVNESPVDVFFSPYSPPPSAIQVPGVLTVHDLTALHFPEMHLESTVDYLKSSLTESMEVVDCIIADSEHTALDLKKIYPETANRISVVPLGVEDRFFAAVDSSLMAGILSKYGLAEKGYIIYIGNLETRKNLIRVVKAYQRSFLPGHIALVLAGTPRWGSEELLDYIKENGLSSQVRILDYVPDEDLPALYRGALFFVYVSLYEGFGLPVLEAMASGTPVLVSNVSSLPEVGGDAAFYVNPLRIEEIRSGMNLLFRDASLRETLSGAGLSRSKEYSWMKTARNIRRILIDTGKRNR